MDGFEKIQLDRAQRHVLLCTGPDCCAPEAGLASWETLKRGIAERKLPVLRTKAACLRLCRGGPWMVVYPDGDWYGDVTPERCARILEQHLEQGKPVEEWAARHHPLPPA